MKLPTTKARQTYAALTDIGHKFEFQPEDLGLGAEFEFKPVKPRQTNSQRGYYWRSINAWGKTLGYSARETEKHLHPVICCEAWGVKERKMIAGHVREIPNETSSSQKRDQYSYLIETLIRVAAMEGFVIQPARSNAV